MAHRPRKVTPASLETAAYAYLERFASSAENLRRVLMRRVERSARAHGTDRDEGAAAASAIVERFVSAGLLDDRAYAEARTAALHRRGVPAGVIRARLREKGVAEVDVAAALDALAAEQPDLELAAAFNLARRRRLGPFRTAGRAAHREKDLAALGRAGFGYDVARHVIDAPGPEAAECGIPFATQTGGTP